MSEQTLRKTYHHGNLRAQLLNQSAEIIAKQGIESLSIRQVAKQLGVSHNAPSRHFENKAELVQNLVLDIMSRQQSRLRSVLEGNKGRHQQAQLRAALWSYLDWCASHPIEAQVIHHPDVRKMADHRIRSSMGDWVKSVEALLGYDRKPEDPVSGAALHFFSLALGGAAILLNPLLRSASEEPDTKILIQRLVDDAYPVS
jgi:AcrR family transcriptional regulator